MDIILSLKQKVEQVQEQSFGTVDGNQVSSYTLRNNQGMEARLINFGATLVSLKVPDRDGKLDDVVLGYDDANAYAMGTASLGATVGRYANRIANGKFVLNGRVYELAKNDGDNTLHGGIRGFNKVMWNAADCSAASPALRLTYRSKDGEEGFPGALTAAITFTLSAESELRIDYEISTDKDTVQNLSHHSYFNLAPNGRDILRHELRLNADRFTPVDAAMIPTGELRDVEGTPFDFRVASAIGARIDQADEQLQRGKGYDHNWVLNGESGTLRSAATVYEATSGRVMEVSTTEPGIQFYTGNYLHGECGKNGRSYPRRSGFCLETQHYPDSPNQAGFPATLLKAGDRYRSTTIFGFSVS